MTRPFDRRTRPKPGLSCRHAQEAISARQDGEPLPVRMAALDAHFTVCPACRALRDRVASTLPDQRLSLRTSRTPPPALIRDLVALLEPPPFGAAQVARRRGRMRRATGRRSLARATQWTAATAVVVVAAIALPIGAGAHPRLVPSRQPTTCTAGLDRRQHPAGLISEAG
jgi:predicted anti-sigma-YlaC factor YlaD